MAGARAEAAGRPPVAVGGPPRVYAGALAVAAAPARTPAGEGMELRGDAGEGFEREGMPAGEEGPPLEVIAAGESAEAPQTITRGPVARPTADVESGPVPPLAELTARVPVALQETMDELFRARFVRVARVPSPPVAPAGA